MRKIINFAVGNPVTISMVVLAVLLLGYISYDRLNVDLLPNMNSPRLFIEIEAGERPPEEIEKLFIENMESMAIRQRDVTQVSSVIKAGSARLTVEYVQNKDMDEAFLDLQKAMATFSQSTGQSSGISAINITQHDPNTAPVMLIAMSHRTISDMAELRKIAESYIRNELVRLEGVAEVSLSGQERPILTIKTDAYKLKAFGLTVDDIASRIESNNQSISGGRVSELGLQYLVKSTSQFTTVADFENLIVSYKATDATSGGASAQSGNTNRAPLYLHEVAAVSFENERPDNIVRLNGVRCIGLSVYKEMQQNTVRVVEKINSQLGSLAQALPGYEFQVISNQGTFISDAIGEVKNTAIMGMALAILVLFVFLRRIGTTLIVSLSIPVSIVATFNMMYFNDLTINVMTLGGLALGGGMLVDNAIVVIESIFRNHERGLDRRESIITGTSEVSGAVIASTLTTIVVFLPIVYLHGASGELFKDQAWTVAFSLISSLFVALLVIPMLYDKLTGRKERISSTASSLQFNWYSTLLKSFLNHRWIVIILSATLLVGTIFLLPFVGTEFLPRSESKSFSIAVKLPEGTRLERTDAMIQNLEFLMLSVSGDSLCNIYTHAGKGSSDNAVFEGEHTAMMKVVLSKSAPVAPEVVMERFVEATQAIEGLELTFKQDDNTLGSVFGGDELEPIVVEVKGESLEEIAKITDEILVRLTDITGIFNVKSSMADGAPELLVSIDRTMSGINNISAQTIINQIRQQLQGREVGKMDYRGEMRDIIIKTPDVTVRDLQNLVIRSGSQEFLLREIATIESSYAPKEIFRRNQNRINKIVADKDERISLDKAAQQIRQATSDVVLPDNYSITVTGEETKRQESMQSLLWALMLSIILVYMVLASQFESLLHPFTILLTIPLALVGAVLMFFLTGMTLNIMGVIGIIMLAGIAVNNSILLVGRIIQLQTTMSLKDAIVQAGQQRIRPIIMTSLTTILALLPMSFNIGEGAALRSSMAMAVIGGLVTSTLMSLVVIPCVYYVFEQMKRKVIKDEFSVK